MKTLALLLACVAIPLLAVQNTSAQEPDAPEGAIIRSAEVTGFASGRLSPGLRQDINALVGKPLSKDALAALAARIEAEQPEAVAAIRSVTAADGAARVVFLVARISDDQGLEANINARYTIESVEFEGVPKSGIGQTLRDDFQKLVGGRLDDEQIEPLVARLRTELPGYDVSRRSSRGSQRGQIRLVFALREGEGMRWLHFAPSQSKLLYHSDQGWSGVLDMPIGGRDQRVTLNLPLGNDDDLLEEYTGFGLRIETRNAGTERLGLSLSLSRLHESWESTTLDALAVSPGIPEAYRVRSTITPAISFAISPQVRVDGGVSITELESLMHSPNSQMANAATVSVSYDQRWKMGSNISQSVEAGFALNAATDALQSDLIYKRYFGSGRYEYRHGSSSVTAAASAGRITGTAPLFERFSLGNSMTLRGWDKFDLAPAGGDQMFHTSIEYNLAGFALFLDTGSVWTPHASDPEQDHARIRASTGFGFHREGVFLTLGFPLNTDHLDAVFTGGVRF